MMVGLVSTAVLARVLTQHDLATYRQTFLAYDFAAPILTLGLPSALFFFLPRKIGQARQLLIENLLLLFIMAAIFSIFLLCGGTHLLALRFNNPDLANTLPLLVLYPLFILPASAISACLVTQNNISTLVVYNTATKLLLVTLLIVVAFKTSDPRNLVLTNVAVAAADLGIACWLMLRSCPGRITLPRFKGMRDMALYSIPLGLAGMLGTLMLQLDKVIVSALCPPEDFIVYSNGAIEVPLIGIVTSSIAKVLLADMSKACGEGRNEQALRDFRLAASRSASILFPAAVFLFMAADPFIVTLYSDKYAASALPFRIFLIALPLRIVYYGTALMAIGKTRAILFRSIFDLIINAILSVIFVKFFGPIGAAIATVATLYIWTVPYNLKTIGVGFGVSSFSILPMRDLGRIFLCSIASAALPFTFFALAQLPHSLIAFVSLAIIYGACIIPLLGKQDLLPPIPTAISQLPVIRPLCTLIYPNRS